MIPTAFTQRGRLASARFVIVRIGVLRQNLPTIGVLRQVLPRFALLRLGAGVALGACLALGSTAMAAAPDAPAINQRFTHHIEAHLNQLGARLEITASQEPPWQGFRAAFVEYMTPSRPASDHAERDSLDAATLAKQHAERAEERARKLAKLADATAKLQQALGPDQRLVLNEAAHRFVHHEGPWGNHGGPGMGMHGDGDCDGHEAHPALPHE